MGVAQSTDLNSDSTGKFTTGEYGDRGDGSSAWFLRIRKANGADTALGATTDTATPTGNGSLIAIMKAIRDAFKGEDAVHTSADYGLPLLGVRNDTYAALTSASGDYGNVALGPSGEALTCLVPPSSATIGGSIALSETAMAALATNLVIKASAGTLYKITGYNNNAAARFLQFFNATSLPADGTAPAIVLSIPATSSFDFDWGVYGRRFTTGITACFSTTVATKTIAAADMWLNASYK